MSTENSEDLIDDIKVDNEIDSDLEFEGPLSDASSQEKSESSELDDDVEVLNEISVSKSSFEWDFTNRMRTKTRLYNMVNAKPGLLGDAQNVVSIIDCFSLFFSDHILEKALYYTNKYCLCNTKYMNGKLLTLDELKAFLGILIASGRCNGTRLSLKQIWDTNS